MERNNSTATAAFKRTWTPKEDATILQLVAQHGASNWSLIADGLINRTGKQCRERYHNHLQPDVKKGEWTEAEDAKIVELQKLFGNQWAKIAKQLPGRTDNAVKNRWHAAMRSHCKGSQAAASSSSSSSSGRQQVPRLPLVPATIDEIVRKYSPRFETDMNMAGSLDLNQLSHSHNMHSHASLSARTVDYSGEDSPRVSPRLQHNCAAAPTTATGSVPSILSVLRIPIASTSSSSSSSSSDSDSDSNSDMLSEEDLESLAFLINGGALEDDEDSCSESGSEVDGDAFSATCSSITCSGMTTQLQLDRWTLLDTVGAGLRTRSNSHGSSCGGSSGYDGDSTCSDEDVADDATTAVAFPLSLDTSSTSTLDLGGVDLFEQLEISPRAELVGARFGAVQNKQSRRKNGTKRPKAAAAAPSAHLRQCTASSGFSPMTSPDYKKKRAGSVLSSLSAAAPASASASAAGMMMFDVADFSLTPAETDQFQGLGLDGDAALYAQDMF